MICPDNVVQQFALDWVVFILYFLLILAYLGSLVLAFWNLRESREMCVYMYVCIYIFESREKYRGYSTRLASKRLN